MKLWKFLPLLVLPFMLAACGAGDQGDDDDNAPAANQNRDDDDD